MMRRAKRAQFFRLSYICSLISNCWNPKKADFLYLLPKLGKINVCVLVMGSVNLHSKAIFSILQNHVLCCEILFMPNFCNVIDFTWNHANIHLIFTKNREIFIHGFHVSHKWWKVKSQTFLSHMNYAHDSSLISVFSKNQLLHTKLHFIRMNIAPLQQKIGDFPNKESNLVIWYPACLDGCR